jgi:tetratricopeptide (TPR) repeat protein
LQGALDDYNEGIELSPISLNPASLADAYSNRGSVKDAMTNEAGAILDFTKAIELKPFFPDAYVNRGVAKYKKGDLDSASADFTKAIELKPDLAGAYLNRSVVKQIKGDWDGSTADYNKAIELNPALKNVKKTFYIRNN